MAMTFWQEHDELRSSVRALEAKYETMRLATLEWGKDVENLQRWSDQHLLRIERLEADATCPHIVSSDEGTSYCDLSLQTQDKLDRLIAQDRDDITPPPELVRRWIAEIWHEGTPVRVAASDLHIATQAARWGADQLRAARRPKPPSLAEQGLAALERQAVRSVPSLVATNDCEAIRHALERLQQLEKENNDN